MEFLRRTLQNNEHSLEEFSDDLDALLNTFVRKSEISEDLADRLHASVMRLYQEVCQKG